MTALKDFKTSKEMGFTDLPWVARRMQDDEESWEVNVSNPIFKHMTVLVDTTAELSNILAAAPDMYLEGVKLLNGLCKGCAGYKTGCEGCKTRCFRVALEKAQSFETSGEV